MTDFGVNSLRLVLYGWDEIYDASQVALNTAYGQLLVSPDYMIHAGYNADGTMSPTGDYAVETDDSQDPSTWSYNYQAPVSRAAAIGTPFGYNIPWLAGNNYTNWVVAKLASLGVKWVREWATVVGQWDRLLRSGTRDANGYASGPIVFDSNYDWSVIDGMVSATATYGIKLVLTLPPIDPLSVGSIWMLMPGEAYLSSRYINNLYVPLMQAIATRYQNYTHIYIDPINEYTYSQHPATQIIAYQRAIYNASHAITNNIKVQLTSQICSPTDFNDVIGLVNAIGTEHIYDEYVVPHLYDYYPTNTFNLGVQTAALNATLAANGRTDVKIKIDEFGVIAPGQEESLDTPSYAACINNMMAAASAVPNIDAVLAWISVPFSVANNSPWGAGLCQIWDYSSYNAANYPEPFEYTSYHAAIQALGLTPLVPPLQAQNITSTSFDLVIDQTQLPGPYYVAYRNGIPYMASSQILIDSTGNPLRDSNGNIRLEGA